MKYSERCCECGTLDHPVYTCCCAVMAECANLKGLENFKNLSLEKKLEFLEELGILEKDSDKYKLSKDYGG